MRKDFGTKTCFYPQPVMIIAAYDENGEANAMNAAWGGVYANDKVMLRINHGHKTTQNIIARGAFTVAFADVDNVVASDYVGIVSGNDRAAENGKIRLPSDKERSCRCAAHRRAARRHGMHPGEGQ